MSASHSISVLGQSLHLHQHPDGFRSGTDAVFLAAACLATTGQSVLDLGCGVGTAGLCVARRVDEVRLTGIDIQADHVELAQRNAAANDLEAAFICGDIRDLKNERFDHVICNPPYMEDGTNSPTAAKAMAKGDACLQDWIEAALRNLKGRGTVTLVHRADHVDQIINAMDGRFGGVEIIPLWPRVGVAAKRVVVRGVKDSKSPAILHPGVVLHEANGDYTAAAEMILRNATALV